MQMLSWIWYLSRLGLFSMRQRQLKGRFKYWQDWKDPSVAFYFQLVEIHQSCINYKNVYLIPKIQFPLIFTLSIIHEFELNKLCLHPSKSVERKGLKKTIILHSNLFSSFLLLPPVHGVVTTLGAQLMSQSSMLTILTQMWGVVTNCIPQLFKWKLWKVLGNSKSFGACR